MADLDLEAGLAQLRDEGVTIILTTHYIEEAEEMADRIGVINKGEIILVEDKAGLMQKLGKKRLKLHLQSRVDAIPEALAPYHLELSEDGRAVTYNYDTKGERTGITSLLSDLRNAGIVDSRRGVDGGYLLARPAGEIALADVFVPEDMMLPNVSGLRGPFSCLNKARYGITWGPIGAAQVARRYPPVLRLSAALSPCLSIRAGSTQPKPIASA